MAKRKSTSKKTTSTRKTSGAKKSSSRTPALPANLKKWATKAKKFWNAGKEAEKNLGRQLPDGLYKFKLVSCEFEVSQNGRDQLLLVWECTKGEEKGSKFYQRMGLDEQGIAYTFRDLRQLGVDVDGELDTPEKVMELIEVLDQSGIVIKAKVKTQKDSDFQNLRDIKVLDESADDDDDEEEDDGEEEDLDDEEDDDEEDDDEEEDEGDDEEDDDEEEDEDEEEGEDEDEEDEVELEIGDSIFAQYKGKEYPGKVKKVSDKTGKVTVTLDKKLPAKLGGKKTITVPGDDVMFAD